MLNTAFVSTTKEAPPPSSKGVMSKFLAVLGGHKDEVVEEAPAEEPAPLDAADKFKKVLVETIVRWASESFIEKAVLIREMFRSVMAVVRFECIVMLPSSSSYRSTYGKGRKFGERLFVL